MIASAAAAGSLPTARQPQPRARAEVALQRFEERAAVEWRAEAARAGREHMCERVGVRDRVDRDDRLRLAQHVAGLGLQSRPDRVGAALQIDARRDETAAVGRAAQAVQRGRRVQAAHVHVAQAPARAELDREREQRVRDVLGVREQVGVRRERSEHQVRPGERAPQQRERRGADHALAVERGDAQLGRAVRAAQGACDTPGDARSTRTDAARCSARRAAASSRSRLRTRCSTIPP